MKLKTDYIPGKIDIEDTKSCKISRCIYHFPHSSVDTYCLIRIFEFASKTVVIASQILGITKGNRFLIQYIIKDFNLNSKNLHWINHDGLFSCYMPLEEEFLHTVFSHERDSLFSHKKINITEESKITRESVETLIETSLEPVELWVGLDRVAEDRFREAKERRTFELLYHYLRENIEYLYNQPGLIKVLNQSYLGAIFFYPNDNKDFEFVSYAELLDRNDNCSKKITTYVKESPPNEKIIICVCIDNYDPFYTILRKDFFINPTRINFLSIEKLVKCEIKSSGIIEFDVNRYREKTRIEKARLESLLHLYLEHKLERLKDIFRQMESGRSKSESPSGALFYYPEHDQCLFLYRWQLTSKHEKLAIPYVDTYNAETEMVVCFSIYGEDALSVCGIFPK